MVTALDEGLVDIEATQPRTAEDLISSADLASPRAPEPQPPMPLPDISGLASTPAPILRAIGQRLRALGVSPASIAPLLATAEPLSPPLRRPILLHHLRKAREPGALASRLLLFQDALTDAEARAALGELFNPLVATGLVRRRDDRSIVSPFIVSVVDDLYILSDDLSQGDDAVMGLSPATVALAAAAFRADPVGSALDLGCGAGACALVLSRCAARVVGTDINPRAVAMGKINAAINATANVEFREGDLFAPVSGELFDLIATQPPFVPKPAGDAGAAFLYGGRRGDEIALALLAGLRSQLSPQGRALIIAEWPEQGEDPLERRLGAAAGEGLDLLILKAKTVSLDEHAVSYAAAFHPTLDAAFEREAIRRREHLDEVGTRGLTPALTIARRSAHGAGFAEAVSVQSLAGHALTSARIERMLAARDLVTDRGRLLSATLRVPEETIFTQEQVGPGADVPSTIAARFSAAAMVQPIEMTADLLGLVTMIHEAESVREGLERFAEAYEVPVEQALDSALPSVRQALLHGLLEIR